MVRPIEEVCLCCWLIIIPLVHLAEHTTDTVGPKVFDVEVSENVAQCVIRICVAIRPVSA